jgi:hypothetical protein
LDEGTNPFTGELPFILITAPLLAAPLALLLLGWYRRAVVAAMQRASSAGGAGPPEGDGVGEVSSSSVALEAAILDPATVPALDERAAALHREALSRPWRAAAVQAIAGAAYGMVLATAALAASGIGFLPIRFAMLTVVFAWPAVLAIVVVAAPDRRGRLQIGAAYFGLLVALSVLALLTSTSLTIGQILLLFLIENLPASVLLFLFWNRRVRAVGPLLLAFLVVALTGSLGLLSFAGGSDDFLRNLAALGQALGFGAVGLFVGMIVVGFTCFAVPGWLLLQGLGRAYRGKRVSDQSISLDALWLLFAMAHAVYLASEGAAWILAGPSAFVAYRLAAAVSRRRLQRVDDAAGPKLLVLRVFALGPRSEALFDAVTSRWRHVGSVQLIAGPDLATTTVEPHEFLSFVSGRLASLFIGDEAAIDRRLGEIDPQPDRDGRFRVNECFCYGNTWRRVLARLVARSDAVLMDLRGFGPANAGCRTELEALLASVPLGRVTLVVDETTDHAFLEAELQQLAGSVPAASPNLAPGRLQLRQLRLPEVDAGAMRGLMACLCASATAESKA